MVEIKLFLANYILQTKNSYENSTQFRTERNTIVLQREKNKKQKKTENIKALPNSVLSLKT